MIDFDKLELFTYSTIAVRDIYTKNMVAICSGVDPDTLADMIDEITTIEACEFAVIENFGIQWVDDSISIEIHEKISDENIDLLNGARLYDQTYIELQGLEENSWRKFTDGWIYFVRSGNYIKIGHSTRIASRLHDLQIGSPEKLEIMTIEAGGRAEEIRIHKMFKEEYLRGEWFNFTGDLKRYVESKPISDDEIKFHNLEEFTE